MSIFLSTSSTSISSLVVAREESGLLLSPTDDFMSDNTSPELASTLHNLRVIEHSLKGERPEHDSYVPKYKHQLW